MISVVISGNLVDAPKPVFENKAGAVYAIRFGSNTHKRNPQTKKTEKDTVWCSGLIAEKKIQSILPFLQKGTYVIANAPDATLQTYKTNSGEFRAGIDLRYLAGLEAGNLDRGEQQPQQQQPQQQFQQQQPQQQQYQQPQQQYQQPQQQQPPQQQYQGFGDGLPF